MSKARDAWVAVQFYRIGPPTQAEIFRAIELLCLMHNGWTTTPEQPEKESEQ